MLKGILRGTSLAFLLFGLLLTIQGNPAGGIYLIAGAIMDLQHSNLVVNERLKALEEKDKKDATQST